VTLASHPPGESPKSANARDLLQNMSLNRVEDFFIADVGLAGLLAIVFGGSGAPLPTSFMIFPSFVAHGWLAALLAGFIVLHVLAAFYHQFVRRDRLFARMFYGRRASTV
jgi:hypothetical protein